MKTIAFLWLLIVPVYAHSWYAPSCCGGEDCKPVPCDQVTEGPQGSIDWQDKHFNKTQVHPSQDASCHVCIHKDSPICVYIQQSS